MVDLHNLPSCPLQQVKHNDIAHNSTVSLIGRMVVPWSRAGAVLKDGTAAEPEQPGGAFNFAKVVAPKLGRPTPVLSRTKSRKERVEAFVLPPVGLDTTLRPAASLFRFLNFRNADVPLQVNHQIREICGLAGSSLTVVHHR